MRRLVEYAWPGNVRELANVIERAVVLARGPELDLDHEVLDSSVAAAVPALPARPEAAERDGAADAGLDATLEETERHCIRGALERSRWVIEGPRGAARMLKLHPNTLRSRIERLGIRRPGRDAT
jgi:formate hydrogenlyase transcriptional activator